jgi:hypothetical protein
MLACEALLLSVSDHEKLKKEVSSNKYIFYTGSTGIKFY